MKAGHLVAMVISAVFCVTAAAWAQDSTTDPSQSAAPSSDIEVQWLWGEVVTVGDTELTVKTLDYETDTEKEVKLFADEKTVFENAKAVTDIKPQDTVSIDYVMSKDGKNVAKTISVEKPEMSAAPAAEAIAPAVESETAAPAVAAPTQSVSEESQLNEVPAVKEEGLSPASAQ
jgi:hypothetical protein